MPLRGGFGEGGSPPRPLALVQPVPGSVVACRGRGWGVGLEGVRGRGLGRAAAASMVLVHKGDGGEGGQVAHQGGRRGCSSSGSEGVGVRERIVIVPAAG